MIRFNDDWLRAPEMCEWLVRVSNDDSRAYCRWCAIILRAHRSDLMTHSATVKHAKNSTATGTPTGPLNVQIVCSDDPSHVLEIERKTDIRQTLLTPRTQYAKKYRVEWEDLPELKDWLQPFNGDTAKAYCKVCQVHLRAHKHDLVLHGKSSKHKRATELCDPNFITVALGESLNDTPVSISESSTAVKRSCNSDNDETEDIIGTEQSNVMDNICEDTEIIAGDIKDEDSEDKKPGEISIIRVPSNSRAILRNSSRKRRMVVSEVLNAIVMDEFTGYELLQIVKAAVPKL